MPCLSPHNSKLARGWFTAIVFMLVFYLSSDGLLLDCYLCHAYLGETPNVYMLNHPLVLNIAASICLQAHRKQSTGLESYWQPLSHSGLAWYRGALSIEPYTDPRARFTPLSSARKSLRFRILLIVKLILYLAYQFSPKTPVCGLLCLRRRRGPDIYWDFDCLAGIGLTQFGLFVVLSWTPPILFMSYPLLLCFPSNEPG